MRRTKEDTEKTRIQLIRSAINFFYKDGYGETKLKDIATDAGTTRGAIYWHFKDKKGVYYASLDYSIQLIRKYIKEVYDKNTQDGLEKILSCFYALFDLIKKDPYVYKTISLILRNEYSRSGEDIDFKEKIKEEYRISMGNFKKMLLADVNFNPEFDPDDFLLGMVSQIMGIISLWLSHNQSFDLVSKGKYYIKCFACGFMAEQENSFKEFEGEELFCKRIK